MAVVAAPTTKADGRSWDARPRAATFTRIVIVAVPIVVAVIAAVLVGRAVERPSGLGPTLAWVGLLLTVSAVAMVVAERAARRFLPIATLLELTLVFPDRTPSRFAVALRAGMMGRPARRVQQLVDTPHEEAVETVLALVMSLGAHDRRTRGHSERVRAYAEVIAHELRLTADERNRLRWSALLHDIGKLAVHPHVLQKDHALDEDEWEQIRRHPEEGARLVTTLVPWLGDWSAVVAQHHERWDGTGYPAGLAGTEISLGGRIVAVADAFEVMTAGRTYANAIASPAARAELHRCAGSQFDPAIVRAFLNAGIAPVGWGARIAAWFGALALTGRQPSRDLATRTGQALAAAFVAVGMTASVPSVPASAPIETEREAEVAGISIERDADADAETPARAPAAVVPPADPPPADAPAEQPPAAVGPPAPATLPATPTPATATAPLPPAPLAAAPADPPVVPPVPVEPAPPPPPPSPPPPPPPPPPPSAGFAHDDTTTTAGRPLRIAVLENDGVEGVTLDPATLAVVDGPDHSNGRPGGTKGTVTNDGVIAYIPEPSFSGVDSITYRVCTTSGVCEMATVSITVTER